MSVAWNGKPRTVPIGSTVAIARVLTLTKGVKQQLRTLSPRFRWPGGYELHVAIVADGDVDVVLGFVLSKPSSMRPPVLAYEDEGLKAKLIEAAKEQAARPLFAKAYADGRVGARRS